MITCRFTMGGRVRPMTADEGRRLSYTLRPPSWITAIFRRTLFRDLKLWLRARHEGWSLWDVVTTGAPLDRWNAWVEFRGGTPS